MTRALYIVDDADRAQQDDEALREFVELAGGAGALILVCGPASQEAAGLEADYIDRFTGLGARANHLHADQAAEQLERATAVWFAARDDGPLDLPAEVQDEVRRRYAEGLLIGGTGTAVATGSGIDIEGDAPGDRA